MSKSIISGKNVKVSKCYKKGAFMITPPLLRHVTKQTIIDSAEVLESGVYTDGSHYQVILVNTHESELDFGAEGVTA